MLLDSEKLSHFFFKILNLKSQAIPVGNTPRYINAKVDSIEGFKFQGCSKNKDIGHIIIAPQINMEAVTFSFFLWLIFKVNIPPTT